MKTFKKVISFSIWGDSPFYCQGAIRNAEIAKEIYPDWEVWFYVNGIPNDIKESYIEQVRKLKPAKYIQEQIDSFSSENFDENTVSVHMRSWADDARRQCLFSFENYFKYMDEMPDKNFFVCADHQSCIDTLKERYGDRVIDYPKRGEGDFSPGTHYMSTLEASQDAIIEMYLLGMNPTILGSYISTFVEVGWWLNECKGNVIIV